MKRIVAALALCLTVAACGGGSSGAASDGNAPTGAVPVKNPPTHTPKPTPPTPKTALAVVRHLKALDPHIGKLFTYTAKNDPNKLLGRPSGYVSKTNFIDTRISASEETGLDKDDPDRGGSVEYYSTANGAKRRATYLQAEDSASPLFGTEYDYLAGGVLLRVSGELTPGHARQFKRELSRIMQKAATGPVTAK